VRKRPNDQNVVWDAESGGSAEHVFTWGADAPTEKRTLLDVWPIEKHCEA